MAATTKTLTRDDYSVGAGTVIRTGPRRFEEIAEVLHETERYMTVELVGGDQHVLEFGAKITVR